MLGGASDVDSTESLQSLVRRRRVSDQKDSPYETKTHQEQPADDAEEYLSAQAAILTELERGECRSSIVEVNFMQATLTFDLGETFGLFAVSRSRQEMNQFSYEQLLDPASVENLRFVSSYGICEDQVELFLSKIDSLNGLKILDVEQHKLKQETLDELARSGSFKTLDLGRNAIFPKQPLTFPCVTYLSIDVTLSNHFSNDPTSFHTRLNEAYPNLEKLQIVVNTLKGLDLLNTHTNLKEVHICPRIPGPNNKADLDNALKLLNSNTKGIQFMIHY